ncbi:MAG TPA: AAA family ATPase [Bryobacteraceae bacterium]|jgi:general secretion pathway protein A|nr:AAA family ATPase [Bryobacteraceae bacterium]
MYNQFFGLREDPFNLTPDSRFLFMTWRQRRALAGLTYALLNRKRCLSLIGDIGTGKTTLIAAALRCLPPERIRFSVIYNPTLTSEEFLESALMGFSAAEIPASKPARLAALERLVEHEKSAGRICALIVDEAQKLSFEALEEIRLLGNIELLQVVLVGQIELNQLLGRPEVAALKQRIALRLTIEAISAEEVGQYIAHRWTKAGGSLPVPFAPDAIEAVVRYSARVPRLINVICDNALRLAHADECRNLTAVHILEAVRSLDLAEPVLEPASPAPLKAAAAAAGRKGILTLG